MKLTNKQVKWFEKEQKEFGTKTALFNLLWIVATAMLHDIGCNTIHACEEEDCDGKKCN